MLLPNGCGSQHSLLALTYLSPSIICLAFVGIEFLALTPGLIAVFSAYSQKNF